MIGFQISGVDYAPNDLEAQTPFDVSLLRKMPGPDRLDYWLGELSKPLHCDATYTITHRTLAARYVGDELGPNVRQVTVGIGYVMDPSVLQASTLDLKKVEYVAIGVAKRNGG